MKVRAAHRANPEIKKLKNRPSRRQGYFKPSCLAPTHKIRKQDQAENRLTLRTLSSFFIHSCLRLEFLYYYPQLHEHLSCRA